MQTNIVIKTKVAILSLMTFVSSAYAKETFPLESWIKECKISSADIDPLGASSVADGITIEKHGKWGWSAKVEAAEGVLVIHPLAKDKPAEIKFKISPLEDKSKKIVILARGSNHKPGVSMKVSAKEKSVGEITLGPKWEKFEIAVSDLPSGTNEISIEISPISWHYEYCYIDCIEIR